MLKSTGRPGGLLKRLLLETAIGRAALVLPRAAMAFRMARILPRIGDIAKWSVRSREVVNFTYATTDKSQRELCATVASIAGCSIGQILAFRDELLVDTELIAFVEAQQVSSAARWSTDSGFKPGRRLAFYLLARALKPAFVVEAGVDKGLGALLVMRALERNSAEGRPGDYLGIEWSPTKPVPLYENYGRRTGRIARGDSSAVIAELTRPIDLFIHDTTPEPSHVATQLAALAPRLSGHPSIVSTWPMPRLMDFAIEHGLEHLSCQEEPQDHWFHGDRLSFAFRRPA